MLSSVAVKVVTEIGLKDQDIITKETAKTLGSKAVESFVDKISKRLFSEWKPICFGDWYKEEISKLLKQSE